MFCRIKAVLKKLITISSFFAYYRLQSASKYFVNTDLDSKDNFNTTRQSNSLPYLRAALLDPTPHLV